MERLADHKLREGDIVFGRKGSVDRHCLITKGQDGWMQGSDCIRVRFTDSFVLPDFVSYYLLTDAVKAKINNSAVGSTMASLNTDILGDIEINLPSIFKGIRINTLLETELCVPPLSVILKFEERLASTFPLKSKNYEEIQRLSNLRDWLLPMLMNGQATIGD